MRSILVPPVLVLLFLPAAAGNLLPEASFEEKPVISFEDRNPFDGGTVAGEHATDGSKALRLERNYAVMDGPQDWNGFEYLKADVHTGFKLGDREPQGVADFTALRSELDAEIEALR